MDTFVRNLDGYLLLGNTPIDSAISNYQADGFPLEPKIVGWASYGRMKSILHRVLGKQVFDTLFREETGAVNGSTFGLASTMIMHYVLRPDPEIDLQTTLVANLIATRCNLSGNHRARAVSFCDRMTEACGFDRDYAKHIKTKLLDDGVMTLPWWVTIKY